MNRILLLLTVLTCACAPSSHYKPYAHECAIQMRLARSHEDSIAVLNYEPGLREEGGGQGVFGADKTLHTNRCAQWADSTFHFPGAWEK